VGVGDSDDRLFKIVVLKTNRAKHGSIRTSLDATRDGMAACVLTLSKAFSQT
jgi:hypothetical protein